ncbi:MAG: metal ABC transporter substrate-binding protein [Thaumarchaeota archaeon]|nr:metal ABC transporter substrate-binding protein [Candidatus Calditenuaceae archaeon]MDW8186530.1 metal ABC transporter substrate-binding protein [Nitrososphaerota archaeon]
MKRQKLVIAIAVLLASAAVLLTSNVAFRPSTTDVSTATGRSVVVSIGVLGEIVYRLTDGSVEVQTVIQSGADLHDWEPTPRDVEKVRRAVLVLYVMKTLDGRMIDLARSAGSNARVVEVSAHHSVRTLMMNGAPDPHVWLSLRNYAAMIDVVASELITAFPEMSDRIRSRADRLKGEVLGLYNEFLGKFEKHRGKLFVTEHRAFSYLAEEFGLRSLALIGAEEEELSPRWLSTLKGEVLKNDVKVVYAEPLLTHQEHHHASALLERFAEELQLQVKFLDPLEGMDLEDALKGRGYVQMMRENLESLLEGFES